MANNVKKVNTIAIADIGKVNGQNDTDLAKLNGEEFTGVVPDWKGSRAIIGGGWAYNAAGSGQSVISILYKTLVSDVDTSDFGDLAAAKQVFTGSGSNGTTVVMGGGSSYPASGGSSYTTVTIDYMTAASVGTVGDAGDLDQTSREGSNQGASNGTLCFFVGGHFGSSPYNLDSMQQMTISSTGGASGAGDIQGGATSKHTTSNGDTKFLIMGIGTAEAAKTAIDTHDFDTSGDSSAYGSVATIAMGRTASVSATNRVVTGGGYVQFGPTIIGTRMSFFPVASNADGDSSDEADLVVGAAGHGATSNGTRGEFYGGFASSSDGYAQSDIQKITIASLANTTDVGDLTTPEFASGSQYSTGDIYGMSGCSAQTAIN